LSAYILEWLSLFGRWVHLITGIAWIGSSFYFVWLDNHLRAPAAEADARRGVGGELWSVHGGGFYHAQKYKLAPPKLPDTLHWFYWEAYSTLLSGVFLLGLLYYGQAAIYLIDPAVAALSVPVAIATSLGFLAGGWLVYDGLCRTPLARHGGALAAVLALVLSAAAWGLCHLYSGRAAFIHFGAMLGIIMVANVFFVIIPGQRKVVAALAEGRTPDPAIAARGKLRSVHNTYFTLPVLFTMISNHYATTFASRWNWLVLIALCAAGALLRAWFVARHFAAHRGGRTPPWTLIAGLLLLAGTAVALRPQPVSQSRAGADQPPGATIESRHDRARRILQARCVACHAAKPTFAGFAAAPKGLLLEDNSQIAAKLPLLILQVESRVMPIGNVTGMTDDERTELLGWFRDGAD
jgi:uncharacterized membrane protein